MTTSGTGMDAEEKATLWRYQRDVRQAAERLRELLIQPHGPDPEAKPALPHIEEMIEYECGTLQVLKEVAEQAERLGKE